ncbi:MAG: DUF1800 family protein [Acidobacteriota bacterium]
MNSDHAAISKSPSYFPGSRCLFLAGLALGCLLLLGQTNALAQARNDAARRPRPAAATVIAGTKFYTVAPCRIFDSRTPANAPSLPAGQVRTMSATSCGASPTATAASLNVAVTQSTGDGFVVLFAAGSPQPPTSTMNYRAGQTRANNAIVPLAGGALSAVPGQSSGTVDLIVDLNGYFDSPTNNQPPTVTVGPAQTINFPSGTVVAGTATDDGLPSGSVLSTSWSKQSGPGTVSFGAPTSLSTVANFSIAGTYVLRLSATDGALTSRADMVVTVTPTSPDVVRFLEQATFGPSDSLALSVQNMGIGAYLSQQLSTASSGWPTLALQPTSVPATCDATCQRDNYSMYPLQIRFFTNALYGSDQLRQRIIWTLHQLLVVSGRDITQPSWMLPYLQILDRNAFGNYRQILYEMTLNPAMGNYLDMATSTKTNPNENYAREILQLFSIGTVLLNQDGTPQLDTFGDPLPSYSQAQVTSFARVFTGWRLSAPVAAGVPDYVTPMVLVASNHDTGSKTLLNGTVLPANQTAVQDLNAALDNIFNHPNMGPFLAMHFIHRLVTNNPTPAYVSRAAGAFNDDGSGVRGNLSALIGAVLMDPEARGSVRAEPNYGHLREPFQYALNLLRAFNAKSANLAASSDGYINPQTSAMNQDVLRPLTVFSYYPSDYLLPGSTTILAPQFGLMDSTSALKRANFVNTMVFSAIAVGANSPAGTALDLSGLQAMAGDPAGMVSYLDRLMLHGTISSGMQSSIVNAVAAVPASNPRLRAQQALYLMATSSQYQVER